MSEAARDRAALARRQEKDAIAQIRRRLESAQCWARYQGFVNVAAELAEALDWLKVLDRADD